MNDDTGGALGNLHTLHSPALEGGFYPESHVLKATIYHFACLYDETHAAVDEFMQKYVPMNQAIKPLLEADRELEYYFSLITNDASAGGTAVPAPVKAYLVDNERLQNFRNIVARLDGERKRVDGVDIWRASQMQKTLLEVIDQQRAVLVQVAGKFVKGRLADVVAIINGFEGQAEIVKFETSKAEKELLEQNIDAKERLLGQAIFRPTVPDDRHTYWPFDGEYWPDELGYYRYTLKNACGEDRGGRAASR
jgi:hypothetical protein